MKKIVGFTAAVMTLAAGGCLQQPVMQTGSSAEVTHDGLHRVDHAAFANVWVKPGTTIARYHKILPVKAEFHYRSVETRNRRAGDDFEVPERRRENFERMVTESFEKQLAKSKHFELTQSAGRDTLVLIGGLYDIVSHVPPVSGGRESTYVSSIGEATLVLELRDSLSNEVLARVVERREVTPSRELERSSGVATASEVRRTAAQWGRTLRERLDALPEAPAIPAQ